MVNNHSLGITSIPWRPLPLLPVVLALVPLQKEWSIIILCWSVAQLRLSRYVKPRAWNIISINVYKIERSWMYDRTHHCDRVIQVWYSSYLSQIPGFYCLPFGKNHKELWLNVNSLKLPLQPSCSPCTQSNVPTFFPKDQISCQVII